jgi:ABC-type multidrug transport system fused ATPase/permease subunit
MDNIIVIKDGELVQQGNHHELLDEVPYYNQLYNIQASKYLS